jgi:hypothetical protein
MARIKCGECKGTHATVDEVRDCHAQAADYLASIDAEIYAEAISSWCAGGGDYMGAKVYAGVIASGKTWEQHLREQDEAFAKVAEAAGTCDHGLSAVLCAGPGHYPMDDPADF